MGRDGPQRSARRSVRVPRRPRPDTRTELTAGADDWEQSARSVMHVRSRRSDGEHRRRARPVCAASHRRAPGRRGGVRLQRLSDAARGPDPRLGHSAQEPRRAGRLPHPPTRSPQEHLWPSAASGFTCGRETCRDAFQNWIGLCPARDWKYVLKLVALLKPMCAAIRTVGSSLWARRRLASSMTPSSMNPDEPLGGAMPGTYGPVLEGHAEGVLPE